MSDSLRLRIASTWDGQPLAVDETSTLALEASSRGWRLLVEAPFHGDPPPPSPAGRRDGLWQHEVVELFVAEADGTRYTEIELSPSGHFLVLRLVGVRQVDRDDDEIQFQATVEDGRWRGEAILPSDLLPSPPWRANAFAMHGAGAQRRFLASTPVGGAEPDFHRPERFPAVARR